MYPGMARSPRLRLEIAPAVGLVIAAFLPFAAWNFGADTSSYYFPSLSFSLVNLLNIDLDSLGGLLIVTGGAMACVTGIYRTAQGWPGSTSAVVGLVGFLLFGAGVLAMAAQWSAMFSGSYTTSIGLSAGVSAGFWVELALAVGGAAICVFNLARPIGSPESAGAQQHWPGGPPNAWSGGWSNGWPGAWSAYAQPGPAQPAGPIKARLTLTQGANSSTTEISAGRTVIVGSDPAADVVVSEPYASPRQLSLTLTSAGWTIQPLDPANPAHLWDSAGMSGLLHGEAHVVAGQIQIVTTQITMEQPAAA